MVRLSACVLLVLLGGCGVDQSRGSALNACRLRYYLQDTATQATTIPGCMAAGSFDMVAECTASPDAWDWRVSEFAYNDPKCYRPRGSKAWLATALSPM